MLDKERDDSMLAETIDPRTKLNWEIKKDEAFWEQCARTNWLTVGDRNTSFLHRFATARKRKNRIS